MCFTEQGDHSQHFWDSSKENLCLAAPLKGNPCQCSSLEKTQTLKLSIIFKLKKKDVRLLKNICESLRMYASITFSSFQVEVLTIK